MTDRVYHFSSTLALPWIIAAGELRPSTFGGPTDNYIWATSYPEGERTAAASHLGDWWEFGQAEIVRFTLNAADFIPWDEIKKTPLWVGADPEMLELREKCARDGCREHDVSKWHLRRELLPLTSVLSVDTRSQRGRWRRIRATRKQCIKTPEDFPIMGFNIDGFEYYSKRLQDGDGEFYYTVPDREELAEMWAELQEHE